MDIVSIILSTANLVVSAFIIHLLTMQIGKEESTVKNVQYTVQKKQTTATVDEDEEEEKDETIPIEQFTPDFTKPIRIIKEE